MQVLPHAPSDSPCKTRRSAASVAVTSGRAEQGFRGARRGMEVHRAWHAARQDPQYRHHRAYRRGQDHHDRADPVLHRNVIQDRRGARRQHHDRLHGAGARARHHHHLGRGDLRVERPPDQHHRHAGPHRFQHRGEPQPARARRRGIHHRGRRRRAAAVRDQLASRRPLQRSAHYLHQQAGPHRRRLLPRVRHAEGEARHRGAAAAAADRHRGQVRSAWSIWWR